MAIAMLLVASPARGHYIYTCPGFAHDASAHRYALPPDCHADPSAHPATHQWLTYQAARILRNDGYGKPSTFLASSAPGGGTYIDRVRDGVVRADTGLNGCTAYGNSVGWPLGDHMLNPYRHFGVWSYNLHEALGWQGFLYAGSGGRRTGSCASAPRVRSTSAAMADEFFNRARAAWGAGDYAAAMVNLGTALHVVQDATVPSHTHPEVDLATIRIRTSCCGVVRGLDAFPAWANVAKEQHAIASGGKYRPPATLHGVDIARTAGGWVYWMAAASYPYFPWNARWSAIAHDAARCDASDFPVECANASDALLRRAQAASAGFIQYFFASIGYPDGRSRP
jgi:hypothetical protein